MATANKIELVSNRVERAKQFLLYQFQDKPNINAIVEVVVSELQELETALCDLQEVRTLKGARGIYLDEIGERLKVSRGNYTDNDYKTAIKIAMAKKTSSATAEDILFIVNLLTNDNTAILTNNYPYLMELTGYLFCIADDPAGLSALADLFPVNTRIRLIQHYGKSFKFGTSGRGFGSGSTLNNLAYYRYGNTNDDRFTTVAQAVIPPALTTPPYNITLPSIYGDNTSGSTLTLIVGSWGGDDPITLTYQWLRDGSNISGEVADTYIVDVADLGTSISCVVTATNSYGTANNVTNTILIEEEAPPVSVLTDDLGIRYTQASEIWNGGSGVTSTASITFSSDGTTLIEENVYTESDQWLTTTGVGLGSDYNISYSIVSGTQFSSLNPNTLYNLGSDITFTKTIIGNGQRIIQGDYIFTIRSISDGTIVGTKQVTIVAEIIDTFS